MNEEWKDGLGNASNLNPQGSQEDTTQNIEYTKVQAENKTLDMESIQQRLQESLNQQLNIPEHPQPEQPIDSNIQPEQAVSPNYTFWAEQAATCNTTGDTLLQQPNFTFVEAPETTCTAEHLDNVEKQKNGKGKKLVKLVASAAIFGLVAGTGFLGMQYGAQKLGIIKEDTAVLSGQGLGLNGTKGGNSIATTTVSSGNTITAPGDLSSVVEAAMPSIVSITSTVTQTYSYWGQYYDQDTTGSGSGIIVEQTDKELLIVTNNHVIDGAKYIAVAFNEEQEDDDKVIQATVRGTDASNDLAVISVKLSDLQKDTLKNIKVAEIGSSDEVKVGELAIAIGNSLGYGQSLTVGYISAKDRKVEMDNGSMTLLQTDAAINPGNSGGALLNKDGKVIGINSAKYSDTSVEGMGFAIPISKAVPIIEGLSLAEEERGYLGISGADVTEEDNQKYNMPLGVYVNEVSEDGAAKAAGIVKGDIITMVADAKVSTIQQLKELLYNYRIHEKVTIKIMRYQKGSYQEKSIEVTLKGTDTLNSLSDGTNANSNNSQGNGQQQNPNSNPDNGQQQDPNGNQDNGQQQNPNGNQGNGQQQNPNGNQGNGQQQMPDDEMMQEFYDYFNQYYGN